MSQAAVTHPPSPSERAVRLFFYPEILPLGRCTHSLEPRPLESLGAENGSTSWKKGDPGTGLILGGRAPQKAVLLGPVEGGKALGG